MSPVTNILIGLCLITGFYAAGRSIVETYPVARVASLTNFAPASWDYFWKLNIQNAPMDKKRVLYYTDYYEHLLAVYPSLRDAYGVLGCCYHYLGDDNKAVLYLKKAIAFNPSFSWNYYNLAVLYIYQSRYREAGPLLLQLLQVEPQKSLQMMFASPYVYAPLLAAGGKDALAGAARHLNLSYKVSYDLLQFISPLADRDKAGAVLKKMQLELYVF